MTEQKDYSQQDQEIVEKTISNQNSHYEVLGVTNHSNFSFSRDVLYAYKRLAKQLHPDKNRAPNSTKAFQILQNAYETLSDPASRTEYDAGTKEKQEEKPPEDFFFADLEELLRRAQENARRTSDFYGGGEGGRWETFDSWESFQRAKNNETEKKFQAVLVLVIMFACIAAGIQLSIYAKEFKTGRKVKMEPVKKSDFPPPFLIEASNETAFRQVCQSDFRRFCLLAFLPRLDQCPKECRLRQLRFLSTMSAKYRLQTSDFLWAEFGAQFELQRALKMTEDDETPKLVMISMKKKGFWVMEGFSRKSVEAFMVDRGVMNKFPEEGLPGLNLVRPWDGNGEASFVRSLVDDLLWRIGVI